MSEIRRRRYVKLTAEQCRRIVEWKRLKDLCKEIGVPLRAAEKIRTKQKQVFQ